MKRMLVKLMFRIILIRPYYKVWRNNLERKMDDYRKPIDEMV